MIALHGRQNRTSRRSHSRVNDDHVNSTRRKIGIGLRDSECSIQYVERLHRVANIDDSGVGNEVEDHTLNRPHKVIVNSKVSGKSD